MANSQSNENPLLLDASTLPRFRDIEPYHVEPGIPCAHVLEVEARCSIKSRPIRRRRGSGVIEPIERMHDRLGSSWGIVEHLMSVRNSAGAP